jgi:hypothetical protein
MLFSGKVIMVMSSFLRAVIGLLVRIAVLAIVMRITIGGLRIRLSAVGFHLLHYEKFNGN